MPINSSKTKSCDIAFIHQFIKQAVNIISDTNNQLNE